VCNDGGQAATGDERMIGGKALQYGLVAVLLPPLEFPKSWADKLRGPRENEFMLA